MLEPEGFPILRALVHAITGKRIHLADEGVNPEQPVHVYIVEEGKSNDGEEGAG